VNKGPCLLSTLESRCELHPDPFTHLHYGVFSIHIHLSTSAICHLISPTARPIPSPSGAASTTWPSPRIYVVKYVYIAVYTTFRTPQYFGIDLDTLPRLPITYLHDTNYFRPTAQGRKCGVTGHAIE
jgi:hypothetical protein